jgi:lambda family phage tail tape measure protein
MASPLEEIKIALKVTDANASSVVKKLESSFRGLANASKQLDAQGISKVRDRIKAFDTAGKRNINTIQSQISALRGLRNEAQIGSSQFKQLTADIAKYDQELQKAQGTKKRGGRLVGAAKSVGAIAAAGVFGGPEGAIGAGIGALAGGPVGAAVGGAIGAQVGQFRQALGATAEYAANLQKLRIALEGVTTSQQEYSQGLDFIQKTTQDFAIPQEVVTRQFTKLQASVQGAGGNLDDTKLAFNGIVAAVRATGGSLADVDAALTATAQVFSKGKVSAEELRQQIGERLPGAFTLFAESMGITPQELDKALEKGEVSLQDFQKFAKAIFDRYGENAKAIADSPAAAGDRLKVSLEKLQENIGTLLGPVGAAFQKTFEQIVNAINTGITALTNFLGIGTEGAINKAQRELDSALKGYERYQDLTDDQIANMDNRTRNRYLQSRRKVQVAVANLEAAKKNRAVVQVTQPTQGGGLPGIDPNKPTGTPGKAPASERMVTLTGLLADKVGKVGERELITLNYMIAKQKILDRNLKATDQQVELNGALTNFRKQIAALDEKEAAAKDQALAKVTKFEQLEANLLAKKMGLTGEQTKQQLLQANINTLTDQYKQAMLDANIPAAEVKRRIEEAAQAMVDLKDKGKSFAEQFGEGIKSMGDLTGNLANLAVNAFTTMSDTLTEFIITGKANFSDFARSIINDLTKIFVRYAMFQAIGAIFPGMKPFLGLAGKGAVVGGKGGPPTTMPDSVSLMAANGMAFAKNKIVPYAKGGIIGQPTLFKYASGGAGRFGLMGEAGPEAIMPLRRGANGKLGVEASGSGMGVTVNVDASGSSVEGDSGQAAQLGKALGIAVQQELLKQKRPGGLLAS